MHRPSDSFKCLLWIKHLRASGPSSAHFVATVIVQKLALALKLMWRKKQTKKAFTLKVNGVKCSHGFLKGTRNQRNFCGLSFMTENNSSCFPRDLARESNSSDQDEIYQQLNKGDPGSCSACSTGHRSVWAHSRTRHVKALPQGQPDSWSSFSTGTWS